MKEKNNTLIEARIKLGKSQREIAKHMGIPYQEYQRYEYGMNKKAIQTAIRIARTLGVKDFNEFCKLWDGNPTTQL